MKHYTVIGPSLFPLMDAPRYPQAPGAKVSTGPSVEAAQKVTGRANRLRKLVHEALCRTPLTAHELADFLNEDDKATSPRISELRAEGLVVDSGMRRPNRSGHNATVWRGVGQ